MKYIAAVVLLLFIYGCENVRHKIGISTKPLQSGEDLKNSTKLNFSIIFGKVRIKKTDGTEDED